MAVFSFQGPISNEYSFVEKFLAKFPAEPDAQNELHVMKARFEVSFV